MEKKFNKKEGEGRDLMIIHVDVDVCKKVESWEKVMVNKTHDSCQFPFPNRKCKNIIPNGKRGKQDRPPEAA